MRSRIFLLVGGLSLLIGPTTALTQFGPPGAPQGGAPQGGGFPGGGGGGRGGGGMGGGGWRGGGGGMMNMDPNERWNQMTGGKDVWVRAEITDQRQQMFFDFIARSVGSSNGQITKQQYLDWAQQMAQRFQQGGMGRVRPGGMGGPPGGPGGGAPGGAAGAPGGPGGFNSDTWAEVLFRRFDRNGDGLLTYEEMPDTLKAERDKFDTNKDGFIDLNEFKEFVKARSEQIRAEMGNGGPGGFGAGGPIMAPPVPIEEEEEKKQVVVYRAGQLPKELPPWFQQLDKDGDGQIGLYEWKASGRPLDEFLKMDLNGDGFLTVEEVLKATAKGQAGGPAAGNGSPGGPPGGRPQFSPAQGNGSPMQFRGGPQGFGGRGRRGG